MKLASLKSKFRAAALSGLGLLGLMAGCAQRPAAPASPPPEMQILINPFSSTKNSELRGSATDWKPREDSLLKNGFYRAAYQPWLEGLDALKALPLHRQAERIQELVNDRVTWVNDSTNHGAAEYFASSVETVLTGRGDCEDFAIAKYCALRHLGVPESRLAMLGVATNPFDSILHHASHAVLAVDTSAANDWINPLILDDNETLPSPVLVLGATPFTPCFVFDDKELRLCIVKVRKNKAPAP